MGYFILYGFIAVSRCGYSNLTIHSSCPNNVIQQWNSRNVDIQLKLWWNSLTYTFDSDGLSISFFNRGNKKVVQNPSDMTVRTISRYYDADKSMTMWQELDTFPNSGLLYQEKGSDMIYIYSDFKTALQGRFDDDGLLIEGVEGVVTAERCNLGIKEIKI